MLQIGRATIEYHWKALPIISCSPAKVCVTEAYQKTFRGRTRSTSQFFTFLLTWEIIRRAKFSSLFKKLVTLAWQKFARKGTARFCNLWTTNYGIVVEGIIIPNTTHFTLAAMCNIDMLDIISILNIPDVLPNKIITVRLFMAILVNRDVAHSMHK